MNIGDYELYFGQLHAHTNLSDGTGTVAQAFDHASKVANLDFLALTDHPTPSTMTAECIWTMKTLRN